MKDDADPLPFVSSYPQKGIQGPGFSTGVHSYQYVPYSF